MKSPVLVTGFGAFPGVEQNPTMVLAQAMDGLVVAGHPVVGEVLPVTWLGGPQQAIARAQALDASLVVGLGVAMDRSQVCVETVAYPEWRASVDAAGQLPPSCEGPATVEASLDCVRLAQALGAELSSDAGRYVCNAWLYQVGRALSCPVGFVHVPASGMTPERLLQGLGALLER